MDQSVREKWPSYWVSLSWRNDKSHPKGNPQKMQWSTAQIYTSAHAIPSLYFEDQNLTSLAGVVILQTEK
jgi:hypothetical protein